MLQRRTGRLQSCNIIRINQDKLNFDLTLNSFKFLKKFRLTQGGLVFYKKTQNSFIIYKNLR